MIKKIITNILWISFIAVLLLPVLCEADNAEVLPKGVFMFEGTYYHYFDIDERYNPDGDAEDIAIDYNRELTSDVFPALKPLDPFVGKANIGRSEVDFTLIYRWSEFKFNYGVTDKLTVGVLVPYNYSKNKVKARIDSTNANVGKNPLYGTPDDPVGSPVIPIPMGGIPLTTDDVQNLLGKGLDVNNDGTVDIPGFEFKRVDSWHDSGVGDIELAAKYQFLKNDNWRLAFVTGVRLPTGEVDDPGTLQDIPFGDGNTDLLFRFHGDYIGTKNLILNGTIRYDLQLPDKEKKRVPDDVNNPLTINEETVERDLGDIVELEAYSIYSFTEEIFGGLKYRYSKKFKDDVDGDKGYAYSSLEDETDFTSHMFFVSLGYSTIKKYLAKKFPVPFYTILEYRNRFAGENNVTKSQYLSLTLAVFF